MDRSRKIASIFDIEIKAIEVKCNTAEYLQRFIESVIRDFITPTDRDESFIIPPNILAVKKPFLLLEIPYYEQNEIASKQFTEKFYQFTGDKYDITVKLVNEKNKITFSIKTL